MINPTTSDYHTGTRDRENLFMTREIFSRGGSGTGGDLRSTSNGRAR
jgi:hypothetical protein